MLVEAHGTFATATCTVCLRKYEGQQLRVSYMMSVLGKRSLSLVEISTSCLLQPDVMSGKVPQCPTCKGVVKPDIVFFGEELPRHFFKYLKDFPLADLLIVMGTSLEVSDEEDRSLTTSHPAK